jgi:Integrase core domain
VHPAAAYPSHSPWENGYVESFNARLRDELLDGEIFYTLREAKVIESWRRHYNAIGHMQRWAIALPPPRFLCRLLSRAGRATSISCAGRLLLPTSPNLD